MVDSNGPAGKDRSREVLLGLTGVCVRFGGVQALDDVGLEVGRDEIVGLIGPNGAGKTTLLNCISRLQTIDSGAIGFDGRDLLRHKPATLAGVGIARTLQHVSLAADMTVLDNVMVGAYRRGRTGVLRNLVGSPAVYRERAAVAADARRLLKALDLATHENRSAASLPVALQRRVDIARALVCNPSLLLMDEPAAGLNGAELAELGELISRLPKDYGVSGVLLVEHHVGLVMQLCHRVVVLNFGKKIADADPLTVQRNADVQEAYLGTSATTDKDPRR